MIGALSKGAASNILLRGFGRLDGLPTRGTSSMRLGHARDVVLSLAVWKIASSRLKAGAVQSDPPWVPTIAGTTLAPTFAAVSWPMLPRTSICFRISLYALSAFARMVWNGQRKALKGETMVWNGQRKALKGETQHGTD